jgi:regulator of replication initiation timing
MTDIVERLRETLVGYDVWYQGRLKTSDTLLERFSNERKEAAEEITRLRTENEKLRDALIDAAAELQHAYIMGFTERYRDAARAARNAVATIRESGE